MSGTSGGMREGSVPLIMGEYFRSQYAKWDSKPSRPRKEGLLIMCFDDRDNVARWTVVRRAYGGRFVGFIAGEDFVSQPFNRDTFIEWADYYELSQRNFVEIDTSYADVVCQLYLGARRVYYTDDK